MLRLMLFIVMVGLGPLPVEAAPGMSPQERYELGQKYMRRGYYQKAMEHFSVLRNSHRDSEFSTKAELAMADVYFKQGEYDLARVAYEDFSRLHPRHSDLDYAVYRLGLAHYRKASRIAARDQTWTQQAVHAWANFSRRFPDSEYAQEVEAAVRASRDRLARKELGIAQFYAKRSAWPAVIARIQPMLRKYPNSEDRAEAMALLAEALWANNESSEAKEWIGRIQSEQPEEDVLRRLRRKAPELFD